MCFLLLFILTFSFAHQKGDVLIMQQKQLYNVCTYIMTSQEHWREAQIEHGEPKEPYTCTSRGAPAYFVSYLYNYFKVSTDFGFPFREKTIKPCSPGLSGGSVRIISLQPPSSSSSSLLFPFSLTSSDHHCHHI